MMIRDIFKMAIRSMFKRKIRTFLTVLGVIVGSASVTLMMSIGVAVNMNFEALFEEHGSSAVRLNMSSWNDMIPAWYAARIQEHPNVAMVAPILEIQGGGSRLSIGPYEGWINISGVSPDSMEAMGLVIEDGRLLDKSDAFQIVLGSEVPLSFQIPPPPGSFVFIDWANRERPTIPLLNHRFQYTTTSDNSSRPYTLEVVGILQHDPQDWQFANTTFMNIDFAREIAREIYNRNQSQNQTPGQNPTPAQNPGQSSNRNPDMGYNQIMVFADDVRNVNDVLEYIRNDIGFENVFANVEWILIQLESAQSLQAMLSAIAAVSLFIAAIMIANTMVMAIYERRKEIGVMKVIGASITDIRYMFLLESALISSLGGAIGLIFSYFLSFALNNMEIAFLENLVVGDSGIVSYIPLWLFGLSFGFSAVIGLVFGFLPARRATKISALSAIQTS